MMVLSQELFYTKSHEWVRQEDEEHITVGITSHAQELLGDLVYIEFPQLAQQVCSGQECVVIESVKTAAEVYAPIDGEISAINESIQDDPTVINHDPYQAGWLIRIKLTKPFDSNHFMNEQQYTHLIEGEA